MKKILFYLLFLVVGSFIAFYSAPYIRQILYDTGILQEKIMIAGTGSMYPTFPKGEGTSDVVQASQTVAWPSMRKFPSGLNIFGIKLFSYGLKQGDIVDFENEKTREISKQKYGEEAGFVKRVIALPGDSVNLRDGFTMVNGEYIDEPYTAKPKSTYGGEFLPDCQVLTIPAGKVFVMGDNRKASLDSRYDLGLVDIKDIRYVMPVENQTDYQKNYRDTSGDLSLAHTQTTDSAEFVKLLNDKRKEKNLSTLRFVSQLSLSSKRRGDTMIKTNDFSPEAIKSAVTLAKAFKEAGYRNILSAEIFTRGSYEAGELLDNFLEFPQTRNILFSSQYQDIGLSPVLGEIDSCPVEVVVVHLGGYVPPDYKTEDVNSWKSLLENLDEALNSWKQLRNAENIDQSKLDKLLELLEQRKEIAAKVYARMSANQWLTETEENLVSQDKNLAQEANRLVTELNKK